MNIDEICEIVNKNKIPEFGKFLLGEYPYFVESNTGNEEPQNVPEAFDALIFPAWKEKNISNLSQIFVQALLWILDSSEDKNKSIYVVSDWIWYYKFCWNKQENDPQNIYRGIFLLDLHQVASKIKEKLIEEKESLQEDVRWAGSPWNSRHGLWDPILRQAIVVRDKLGGPDYVP